MEYKSIEPITKEEVEKNLSTSLDKFTLSETFFRMMYYIDDINFVEKNIIIFQNLISPERIIDGILGFVFKKGFLPPSFLKILQTYMKDPEFSSLAKETHDFIKSFMKNKE